MDFYFINEGPLWMEILIIILGIFCLAEGLYILKKRESPGPWYAFGLIRFKRDEKPILYWFFTIFWIFFGVFLIIIGLISLL